eukprot:2724234-Amphidinium_carterae.1
MLRAIGSKRSPSAHDCSFAELLNPEGVQVHIFVSHYWGHPFSSTVRCLRHAAEGGVLCSLEQPSLVAYWICAFSLNQHQLTEELGLSPEEAPFNIALLKVSCGVVMIVDDELSPFRRIWCLYEVKRAFELGKPFRMLAETTSVDGECIATKLNMDPCRLAKKLHEVQALNARASKDNDRFAILFRIMNPVQKQRYESFESFKHRMEHPSSKIAAVGHSSFSDFDMRVREYLATPLFQCAILHSELDTALRYATHADLHVSDIKRLLELRADVDCKLQTFIFGEWATETMLHKTCISGDLSVKFLIEEMADIEARLETGTHCHKAVYSMTEWVNGCRPLHMAAWHGNVKAVMHLLSSGADVNALTNGNAPPLYFSTRPYENHEEIDIARALISKKAHCNVVDSRQMTLLHVAASNQNPDLLKLLLEQGLSAEALDEDGSTPLHVSANWGTSSNISLLAAEMATLNVQRHRDGQTPLHRAARSGHK